MSEERMIERRIAEESVRSAQFSVYSARSTPENPARVALFTVVQIQEANEETGKVTEKTLGIVPVGAEDLDKDIYPCNVPRVAVLLGAKVGGKQKLFQSPLQL